MTCIPQIVLSFILIACSFFYFNRADFPILSEHGIMPVTDVNENFSSPINGDNEQDGFNGEPIQQPSTTINTVIIFFNIL